MKKFIISSFLFSFLFYVTACTHKMVAVHKATDYEMSCAQIIEEMKKVEAVKANIKSKKGLSGRNVGMALIFWPGIFVNESNANEALRLAEKRMDVLNQLYKEKKCEKK